MADLGLLTSKYGAFSDEELIGRYRAGEAEIIDYLMDKYKNLVLGKTKSMYLMGGDKEDLIQEGMIGLFGAINNYDFGRDASFFTFADLCITRKIYNSIKASNEKKHSFLNNYASIYASFENDGANDSEEKGFPQQQYKTGEYDPEKIVLTNELREELERAIENDLTDMEREVFMLYLSGMSSGEAARVLGKSPKETDNSIQRAKAKLRKAQAKLN